MGGQEVMVSWEMEQPLAVLRAELSKELLGGAPLGFPSKVFTSGAARLLGDGTTATTRPLRGPGDLGGPGGGGKEFFCNVLTNFVGLLLSFLGFGSLGQNWNELRNNSPKLVWARNAANRSKIDPN